MLVKKNYFYLKFVSMCIFIFILVCCQTQESSWKKVQAQDTIQAYSNFLEKYSEGESVNQAKKRINELYFAEAKKENTISAYENFLKGKYPKREELLNKTQKRISLLYFLEAKKKDTISSYENFLKRYATGQLAEKARNQAEVLQYKRARKLNTVKSYIKFITQYPKGKLVRKALNSLNKLNQFMVKAEIWPYNPLKNRKSPSPKPEKYRFTSKKKNFQIKFMQSSEIRKVSPKPSTICFTFTNKRKQELDISINDMMNMTLTNANGKDVRPITVRIPLSFGEQFIKKIRGTISVIMKPDSKAALIVLFKEAKVGNWIKIGNSIITQIK